MNVSMIGLDIAKSVFAVHSEDATGRVGLRSGTAYRPSVEAEATLAATGA